MEVNLLIAFGAGLLSFLAPCVIPLLPLYISFVSGVSVAELTAKGGQRKFLGRILLTMLLFTAGFSIIFVLLGFGASTLGMTVFSTRPALIRLGGVFILLFGIYLVGIFNRLSISQKTFAITLPESIRKTRFLGPFLIGIVFALTWTPCAGPVLGAILTLALTSTNQMEAAFLLFVYSLGIAVPFLAVGLTIGASQRYLISARRWLWIFEKGAGVILILMGILIATDQFNYLTGFFMTSLYRLPMYEEILQRV